jgi:hypothetical protein
LDYAKEQAELYEAGLKMNQRIFADAELPPRPPMQTSAGGNVQTYGGGSSYMPPGKLLFRTNMLPAPGGLKIGYEIRGDQHSTTFELGSMPRHTVLCVHER